MLAIAELQPGNQQFGLVHTKFREHLTDLHPRNLFRYQQK